MMAGKEGKDMDQEKNEKSIVEENNEQELTLEKFEEASEIVKEVTSETKLIYRVFFFHYRKQGILKAGEPAVHRCLQGARCLLQDQHPLRG